MRIPTQAQPVEKTELKNVMLAFLSDFELNNLTLTAFSYKNGLSIKDANQFLHLARQVRDAEFKEWES